MVLAFERVADELDYYMLHCSFAYSVCLGHVKPALGKSRLIIRHIKRLEVSKWDAENRVT
jgi:hypothetical protein